MHRVILPIVCVLLYGCWSDVQTQMIICASNNDKVCIKKYLDSGEDPNGVGKEGVSPFYAAIRNKNFEIADLFLSKKGFDINGESSGKSYLWRVIKERRVEAVIYLKKRGALFEVESDEFKLCKETNQMELLKMFD